MQPHETPTTEITHIDSDNIVVIWVSVLMKAAEFCKKYNCAAVITEVTTVGKDGRLYLGYEIEKKTPVANN